MTISADGIYGLCKNEFAMIILSVVALGGKHYPVSYSIVPGEDTESYLHTWNGIHSALISLFFKVKLCTDSNCDFCSKVRGIKDHPRMQLSKWMWHARTK